MRITARSTAPGSVALPGAAAPGNGTGGLPRNRPLSLAPPPPARERALPAPPSPVAAPLPSPLTARLRSPLAAPLRDPLGGPRPGPAAPAADAGRLHEPEAAERKLTAVLAELGERIGPLFARPEPRTQAMQYVIGLLGRGDRSNTWQLAQRVGDSSPWRMQRLLTRARWDADAVRDTVLDCLSEKLGHPDSVLVLGQIDALKKGTKTVAAARQYTEVTRRVENCQTALLTSYVSPLGTAVADRALHLPESWTADPQRCRSAGVPEERLAYRTKPQLAREMIQHAMDSALPFGWVSGNQVYGQDEALRHWLEERGAGYVLAVPNSLLAAGPAADAAAKLPWWTAPDDHPDGPSEWRLMRPPPGAPYIKAPAREGFTHSLLLRRRPGRSRTEWFLVHSPEHTAFRTMVDTAVCCQHERRYLEAARLQIGLERHETRTWTAWYRHTTLSLLALTACAVATATAA